MFSQRKIIDEIVIVVIIQVGAILLVKPESAKRPIAEISHPTRVLKTILREWGLSTFDCTNVNTSIISTSRTIASMRAAVV